MVQLGCAYLLPTTTFIGMNVFKSGRMMGETNDLDLANLRFLFKLDLDICDLDLEVI